MDLWFTLFVSVVALAAAVGFSLVLVGYISVMPVVFGQGRAWLWAVAIIPGLIVVVPVLADALYVAFGGDGLPPLALAKRLAIPALLIHLATVLGFLAYRRREYAKPGKQMLIGLVLLLLAVGSLYGIGPKFAERAVMLEKEKR